MFKFDINKETFFQTQKEDTKDEKLSTGAIIVIVIGTIIGLALIGGLIYYFVTNKNSSSGETVSVNSPSDAEAVVNTLPIETELPPFGD